MSQPKAYVSPTCFMIHLLKQRSPSLTFLSFLFFFFFSFLFLKKKNLVKNLIIWLVNSGIIDPQFYFHPLQLTTRTVHPTRRTDQPEQPAQTQTRNRSNQPLWRRLQVSAIKPDALQVSWQVSSPKTQTTWPKNQKPLVIFEGFSTKTYKNRWYLEFFDKDYLKFHQIRWDLVEI